MSPVPQPGGIWVLDFGDTINIHHHEHRDVQLHLVQERAHHIRKEEWDHLADKFKSNWTNLTPWKGDESTETSWRSIIKTSLNCVEDMAHFLQWIDATPVEDLIAEKGASIWSGAVGEYLGRCGTGSEACAVSES